MSRQFLRLNGSSSFRRCMYQTNKAKSLKLSAVATVGLSTSADSPKSPDNSPNFQAPLVSRAPISQSSSAIKMAEQSLFAKAVEIFVQIFWTGFVIVRVLIDTIRNGPKAVLHTKDRSITPDCLTKGWNHEYIRLSTLRLHYVHKGDRSKPLMLFLHGFPEFWYSWRYQLEEFSKDYWCVAVDQRGYNESDKPAKISDYAIGYMSQDVNEIVRALGHKSCILVAHDWGGAVAWNTTMFYPELVDKLIVMNCPHGYVFGKYMKSNLKQFLKSWYMFFFQTPYIPEFVLRLGDHHFLEDAFTAKGMGMRNKQNMTDEDMEAFKYVFGRPGAYTAPINWYRAAFKYRQDPNELKAKKNIQPPTLLIWGTKDGALSMEMAQLSINECRQGTLRLVEGASHWVQQDEPKQVNTYMREFLAGK